MLDPLLGASKPHVALNREGHQMNIELAQSMTSPIKQVDVFAIKANLIRNRVPTGRKFIISSFRWKKRNSV